VTYNSTGGAPRRRRRRGLLLLLLLPLAFVIGWVSADLFGGEHAHPSPASAAPTAPASGAPATAAQATQIAVASPSAGGSEEVGGVEKTSPPTPAPSARVVFDGLDFTITGGVSGLRPGVTAPIRLTLTNPNGVTIYVTRLSVTVAPDSTPPGCHTADNISLTQSNASTTDPIVVPAGGAVTLTTAPRAPLITLLNLPNVNQDVCKSKAFTLTYSGSAHS
jgi:hypothetical protein